MFYKLELTFIEGIDPEQPGSAFNNDPKCFRSYCEMQMNSARNDAQRQYITEQDADNFIEYVTQHINGA